MISSSASSPASLWARSITTRHVAGQGEEVHPARVVLGVGTERRQPGDDVGAVEPDREGGGRGGEGVLDVEARQPGERHRHVGELHERVGVGAGRRTVIQPSMTVVARPPPWPSTSRTAGESGSRLKIHGCARDHRLHGEHARVVAVEHGPAVLAGDPRDDRLDLGELVDGVDALEAEVVGGHVGHHRHVVAGDADALEQDAAAGGLGDGELDALEARARAPAPEGPE